MNRTAAVGRIRRYLAFRSDLETEIIDALQDAQRELEAEAELPWFLEIEEGTIQTTATDRTVAPPTDFIRFQGDGELFYYDSTADEDQRWIKLEKDANSTLRQAYQDAVGPPEAYTLVGANFFVYPIPDAVYTLKATNYYAGAASLSTDIENAWLQYAPDILIGKAGQKVANPVRDGAALTAFAQLEAMGRKRLNDFETAREESGQVRQMGGKD